MKCKNYINGICVLDRSQCRFVDVGRGCPVCNATSLRTASFRQVADVYCEVSGCSEDRKVLARRTASRFATLLGRGFDDEADLNENDFDLIFRRLRDGDNPFFDQQGVTSGCFSLATIKSMFSMWSAMCAYGRGRLQQAIKARMRHIGVSTPRVDDMPIVKVPRKTIRELTVEEVTKLEDRIAILRNSSRECDRQLALWMEIGIETGARPGDIARATWGWFRHDDSRGWIYSYSPRKTKKSRAENIAFGVLSDRFVSLIRTFNNYQDSDALIFPCEEKKRNRSHRTGRYAGENQWIRRRASAEYRAIIGHESHMSQYLARRLKSKRMLENEGMLAESQALCHSPREALRSYANLTTLNTNKGR